MLIHELLTYIFDERSHVLTAMMTAWLGSSRRFTSFVNTYRNKIRKKIRVTQDPETLQDLRLELETAYLLLQEPALSLTYEPESSKQIRSPDFEVMYTTSLRFLLEVTRLRTSKTASENNLQTESERLADAICSKLSQLLPQRNNILILGVDALPLGQNDLQALMLRIQQRAEKNDAAFWRRYSFQDRADFFRHYQRLSEVVVRGSALSEEVPAIFWVNPQAKHSLPGKVRTTLHRSQMIVA